MPTTPSRVPISPRLTVELPTLNDGSPPSQNIAHAADENCTAKRVRAERLLWSSTHPTVAIIAPPPDSAMARSQVIQCSIAATITPPSAVTAIASPPPRGVGGECELRSLGM